MNPDSQSARPGGLCGKIPYPTKAAAIDVRRRLRHRHAAIDGGLLETYYCHACVAWHLGRRFTERAIKKGRTRERGRHWVAEAFEFNEAS